MTNVWKPDLVPSEEPIYLALTKAIADDIALGKLMPGTRLPTHRELADMLGVAIGTVTRAYSEAEKRGLVHGEGRRGTLVGESPRERTSLSTILEVDSHVVDLSKNYPVYSEDPDLAAALKTLSRQPDTQQLLQYPNPAGMAHHRAAGASWIKAMGLDVKPESVLVTAGAQHALTVILSAIAQPGETVLAEAYTYPGIKAVAEMFGIRLAGVAIDREGLDPSALESICKQRRVRALYCNPTLHNPTGIIYSESRRRQIAALAEKYDFIIVEDDIMRPLVPDPPPMLSSLAPDRSCLIASTSKVIAAGLRVGFATAPPKLMRAINDSLQTITLVASSLPTEIVTTWISNGTAEKIIRRRRQEARARRELVDEVLGGNGIRSHPYSAVVWLRLPSQWSSMEFTMEAHRRGVAVVPSDTFAVSKTAVMPAIRICLGPAPSREVLRIGLEIIADMMDSSPRHDTSNV